MNRGTHKSYIHMCGIKWRKSFVKPVVSCTFSCVNRGVHALRGITGNQGKVTKKRSRKTNVFLYMCVLISHLENKYIL